MMNRIVAENVQRQISADLFGDWRDSISTTEMQTTK